MIAGTEHLLIINGATVERVSSTELLCTSPYMAKQYQPLSPKLKLFFFILLVFNKSEYSFTVYFRSFQSCTCCSIDKANAGLLPCFQSNLLRICSMYTCGVLVFNLQAHSILTKRPLERRDSTLSYTNADDQVM